MKKIAPLSLLTLGLLTLNIQSVWAFCSSPSFYESEPSAPGSFERPDVPYCMETYGNGCDQWEIDSYISDVNRYIEKLNNYAQEAEYFANNAIAFANEAIDFANCEAQEVRTQHQ